MKAYFNIPTISLPIQETLKHLNDYVVRGQFRLNSILLRACGPQIALILIGRKALALRPMRIKANRAAKHVSKMEFNSVLRHAVSCRE